MRVASWKGVDVSELVLIQFLLPRHVRQMTASERMLLERHYRGRVGTRQFSWSELLV